MKDFQEHPVFICGHPKAGTSLMTALLDGHPAIVAYPEETLFFRRFLPAIAGKSREEALSLADRLLIHIFEWNQTDPPEHQKNYPDRDYSDIDFMAVRQRLHQELEGQVIADQAYLMAAVAAFGAVTGLQKESSRYWVEKTPYNEFYAEKIFSWWPEAHLIHIVRDPRDNFVSYQRKQPDWTAKVFAWNWVRSTQAGLENQKHYGADRVFLLKFEDLLTDPKEKMQQVAAFLGLSWHDALLQPTRVGDAWRGNSMFSEKYSAISTAPIGRWKKSIQQKDLAMLQIIAKKAMQKMGYGQSEVDLSGLSLPERIKLIREHVVSGLKQI